MLQNSGKNSLLIMDDDLGIQKVLAYFFQKDFNIVIKNDGMEGMSWLEQGNMPDIILADLNMPNLDGKEFLQAVRASNFYGDIPIVILSGEDDSTERIKCLNLGADDFMIKPFNPMEVQAKINAILRRNKRLV